MDDAVEFVENRADDQFACARCNVSTSVHPLTSFECAPSCCIVLVVAAAEAMAMIHHDQLGPET
jgi:hypothetical protein